MPRKPALTPLEQLDSMRNIRERDHAWLVRIRRNGQHIEQVYCYTTPGERERALLAAKCWRDVMLERLPAQTRTRTCRYNRTSARRAAAGHRTGVSRYLIKRRNAIEGQRPYLNFLVAYADAQGRSRVRAFEAGPVATLTPEQETHAYRTAVAFREHWEHCQDTGTRFDPVLYKHWQRVPCYPFVAAG